jgi:hypothetical protein
MKVTPAIQRISAKAKNVGVRLNSVISEAAIFEVEERAGVLLPTDYREFLLYVGNGGDGPPAYGLCSLNKLPPDYTMTLPDCSKPFPFTQAWVWETGETSAEGGQDDARQGILILGTDGCAQYWVLVVNGPDRGKVWMLADVGVTPLFPAMTFLEWYEAWLDGKRDWWS